MLVIADKYIPFLKGILEPYAEVRYLEPDEITPESVRDADALLVRTRTRCNAALLEGSSVRFIATATIGYDHIDTAYCESHGIFWTNSPGCNAQGVCDYVEEALRIVESLKLKVESLKLKVESIKSEVENASTPTLGIVGVGHVGSLVAKMAERKGFRVLLNDPPVETEYIQSLQSNPSSKKGNPFVSLDTIVREADIITFHTPLTKTGAYPTYHLCDEAFLQKCKPGAVIINAARGGIVDEQAALSDRERVFITDTWENEPDINMHFLRRSFIATYHIAGYTLQGKINATNLCLDALCRYFSLPQLQIPAETLPPQPQTKPGWIGDVDRQLRQHPELFETLRETYPLR